MRVLTLSLFLASIGYAAAAVGAPSDRSADVRAEFQRAYASASAESVAGSSDSAALRDYALYPYLEQRRIQLVLASNPGNWSAVDLAAEQFLKAHLIEPVARELRRVWYASLARREEWERYLANYREVDDPVLRCHALTARVKLRQFEGLAAMAAQLWSNAPGSLPACEIPFNWLKTQSAWTPALIERRAKAALDADNPSFARQMMALLPKDLAAPLEQRAVLIEQPQTAVDAAIANPTKSIESSALIDGWIRLARGNPDSAIVRYANLVKSRKLDESVASRLALELALPLSWNRRAEALKYFAKTRTADFDERAWEWYARSAIWNGDWKLAANIIGLMPNSLRAQTRWRYWSARALGEQGEKTEALAQYAALTRDDNYYAVLAAARISKSYTPTPQPIEPNDAQIKSIAQEPPFLRARELQLLNIQELRESAYDEWRFGYNKLSADARVQSVVLASRWGWHDQAILIAAEQRLFSDYRLLYPHAFDAEVDAAAKSSGLPRSIIYATLRQESVFKTNALSSAGAYGLMQLLPKVAAHTARRWQLPAPGDLFDPKINIPIGVAHLKDIYNRFSGRLMLALAGYNAGPNAVARWVPAEPKDADVWIENIPYNETRVYVQRVLWHSIVFGWLANDEAQNASDWLTTITMVKK